MSLIVTFILISVFYRNGLGKNIVLKEKKENKQLYWNNNKYKKEFKIKDIFEILIYRAIYEAPFLFSENCEKEGMIKKDFHRSIYDKNIPEYTNGYHLVLKTEYDFESLFEILGINGSLLQAGIQIYCKEKNKYDYIDCIYDLFKKLSDEYFGYGIKCEEFGIELYNYHDDNKVCYLSRSKIGKLITVTFRIGNAIYWT